MMNISLNKVCLQPATIVNSIGITLAGISMALGAVSLASIPANSAEIAATSSSLKLRNLKLRQLSAAAHGPMAQLPDGIYLYGQSAKPDQIGSGYFVFESKQGKVVGALYMPSSSFDCASGTFGEKQLALTVTNSYDRTTNPFQIAVERVGTVASGGNSALEVSLQGFHKIDAISANDQRLLKVCKADLQKTVK